MTNKEKLEQLLEKKDNECGELSIALRVAEEEYNDIKFLIDDGMTKENVRKVLFSTTSSSLYEFLLSHIEGSLSGDICRCTNETCIKRIGCLRSMLNKSNRVGRFSYSYFTCCEEDSWAHKIHV